jgi:hypothetical protein
LKKRKGGRACWAASPVLEFTEELNRLMVKNSISRSELARWFGVSPAYVTKGLRGDLNFAVETMVRLARVVVGRVHVHVAPEAHEVRWFDVVKGNSRALPIWEQEAFLPAAASYTGWR